MRFVSHVLMAWLTFLSAQGVTSVRYYRTEEDFVRGVSMLATERVSRAHIRVLLNENEWIISKAFVDAAGNVVKEEIYDYDAEGNVVRRSIRNSDGDVEKLYVYGDDEEMSEVFIAYAFPRRDSKEFADRVTVYDYNPNGEIEGYHFLSVDHTEFGAILFGYFDSGPIKEERWIRYPGDKTVRLFQYEFDPDTRRYLMTEYDSTGGVVSHVGIILPEGSDVVVGEGESTFKKGDWEAYHREPGPVGNILEESSEIIEDIRKRRGEGWNPEEEMGALFQEQVANSPDILYLKNGQVLKIDLLHITDEYVRFKLFGEQDILTMPISSVGEIERRDGEIVYPIIY